jgi:hypothetical protein
VTESILKLKPDQKSHIGFKGWADNANHTVIFQ